MINISTNKVLLFAFPFITTAAVCASAINANTNTDFGNTNFNSNAVLQNVLDETGKGNSALTAKISAVAVAPEAVVADLYKQHDAHRGPFFQTKSRTSLDKYFTKAIADLIWKDATTTAPGEVGALDFDPLYNTQDLVKKNFAIGKSQIQNGTAKVRVTYTNFKTKMTIIHLLTMENGKWKIKDIDYGDGSTLLGILKENANPAK